MHFVLSAQLDCLLLDLRVYNRLQEESYHSNDKDVPQSSNQRLVLSKFGRLIQNLFLLFEALRSSLGQPLAY